MPTEKEGPGIDLICGYCKWAPVGEHGGAFALVPGDPCPGCREVGSLQFFEEYFSCKKCSNNFLLFKIPTIESDKPLRVGSVCPKCQPYNRALRAMRREEVEDPSQLVNTLWCDHCRTGYHTTEPVNFDPNRVVFETGAIRNAGVAGETGGEIPLRYDLIFQNTEALRAWAKAFGEGSLKYPAGNWQKGFKQSVLINHAMAHIVCELEGDTSEDHLGHAMWNIATLIWMKKHRPDLMDLVRQPSVDDINEKVAKALKNP